MANNNNNNKNLKEGPLDCLKWGRLEFLWQASNRAKKR